MLLNIHLIIVGERDEYIKNNYKIKFISHNFTYPLCIKFTFRPILRRKKKRPTSCIKTSDTSFRNNLKQNQELKEIKEIKRTKNRFTCRN